MFRKAFVKDYFLHENKGQTFLTLRSILFLCIVLKGDSFYGSYYAHNTQTQYDVHTLQSGNLYQIFTYVKNKDVTYCDAPHEVSGMLLYAKTDEQIQPNHVYHMSGNKISVRTLDLNCPFTQIREQLEQILGEHF